MSMKCLLSACAILALITDEEPFAASPARDVGCCPYRQGT